MSEAVAGSAGFVETFLVRPGPEVGVLAAAAELVPGDLPDIAVLPTDTAAEIECAAAAHAESGARQAWRRGWTDADGGEARAAAYMQGWEAHARRAINAGRQVVAISFASETQRRSFLRSVCAILVQNPFINQAVYGERGNQR